MTVKELTEHANRLSVGNYSIGGVYRMYVEALEFLRTYAGENSAFYKRLAEIDPEWNEDAVQARVTAASHAYIGFLSSGLAKGMSIERKAQIDVVSDFLDQAHRLLENNSVHPAAPCVLIGASLEEFLRNWVEEVKVAISFKPSIDTYATALRNKDLISKQDMKDITSWSGLRNHASHGEWDQVEDRKRIVLMLEGVNLFMRKYENYSI